MEKKMVKIIIAIECMVLSIMIFQISLPKKECEENKYKLVTYVYKKQAELAASNPRIIDEEIYERKKVYELSDIDYQNLLRIVEAEASGEGENGKLLVANVIFNRVKSRKFPNSVTAVIFQQNQFAPTRDGRFYSVKVTQETVRAVDRALYGEDISNGALYFVAVSKASQDKVGWFQTKLTKVCSYGGHEFYK